MITFVSTNSTSDPARYVDGRILGHLADSRRVLWLISGGSCIEVAAEAARAIASSGQQLKNLTISLIDERYGPPGHANSNWAQLQAAGLHLPGATLHPVLTGADQPATAAAFAEFLADQFAAADFRLGLLGIGPDGHTSGILPHSPAVTASGLAFAYDGPDFRRITTTADALAHLDEAVVYVVGQRKWPLLDRLETDLPVADQPAQLLKTIPKLTIFTDRPEK